MPHEILACFVRKPGVLYMGQPRARWI